MTRQDLRSVALTLVAERKGILGADETVPTLVQRFDSLGISSKRQSRRTYRQIWPGRELRSRSAGALPPRQSQRCGKRREVHG